MRPLNNRGITTIEVLLCFILVVIITTSMYGTISSFNNKRLVEQYKEKIFSYKELLTKEIQDDFVQVGLTHAKYTKNVVTANRADGIKKGTVIKDSIILQQKLYEDGFNLQIISREKLLFS